MIYYHASDGQTKVLGDLPNDTLRHWKYIKKIPVGKGFRYFYSWDEYRAYLADPAAELQKTGQNAAQSIRSSGRKATEQIKSYRRTAETYISKGQHKVEQLQSKSREKTNPTIGAIRQINASRSPSIKQRLNDLAKSASKKWNESKESIKETIEKGKEWVKGLKVKHEEAKKAKEEKKAQERERLAKKYKYIKKIVKNGKAYYFYTQDEIDAYNKRREYYNNDPDFMKDVKHSNKPYTSEEDAMLLNPRFDWYDSHDEYENNCAECSAIYELRRRGYDVQSNGESGIGRNWEKYNTENRFDLFYENANIQRPVATDSNDPEETYKSIKAEIEKNPPGSRGDLSFAWNEGGGHSIVWERDLNGDIHIVDTQLSGNGNKVEYDLKKLCYHIDNSSETGSEWGSTNREGAGPDDPVTTVTRTDNLKLKKDIMNICRESSDRKPKPNTNRKMLVEFTKDSVDIRYETMTEEEIIRKYSNILS